MAEILHDYIISLILIIPLENIIKLIFMNNYVPYTENVLICRVIWLCTGIVLICRVTGYCISTLLLEGLIGLTFKAGRETFSRGNVGGDRA